MRLPEPDQRLLLVAQAGVDGIFFAVAFFPAIAHAQPSCIVIAGLSLDNWCARA